MPPAPDHPSSPSAAPGARVLPAVREIALDQPLHWLALAGTGWVLTSAALIMGFTLLGLVFVVPLLGHASWHAYRDLVDASGLPERLPPSGKA